MSRRTQVELLKLCRQLEWERLGPSAAMVTVTYPTDWRRWCPDGKTLTAHRRAFVDGWGRLFGEPMVGLVAVEYQRRGAPHLHLYTRLPEIVTEEEFEGFRVRDIWRHNRAKQVGWAQTRQELKPIGQPYGGAFAMELRHLWANAVGTQVGREGRPGVTRFGEARGTGEKRHHARGVDVRIVCWQRTAEERSANATRYNIGGYLAKESAKWCQKAAPADFDWEGNWFGLLGKSTGFAAKPTLEVWRGSDEVAPIIEAQLDRLQTLRYVAYRRHVPVGYGRRREGDGFDFVDGVTLEQAVRMVQYAERVVARGGARSGGRLTMA